MTSALPPDRAVRLIVETESAARLLTASLVMLKRHHPGPHDADALFACLSIGMEKLLKLSIGLAALHGTGQWPTKRKMKDYFHNVKVMHDEVMQIVETGVPHSTNPPIVDAAITALRTEPLVGWVIESMSRYAREGRFHNLDYLAEGPQAVPSPSQLWTDLEQQVSTPQLIAETLSTTGDNPWRLAATSQVSSAIKAWAHLLQTAWTQGIFGPNGRQLGHVLRLT